MIKFNDKSNNNWNQELLFCWWKRQVDEKIFERFAKSCAKIIINNDSIKEKNKSKYQNDDEICHK